MAHTSKAGAVAGCRRLQELLQAPPTPNRGGPRQPVRAFFGLADTTQKTSSVEAILRIADENLRSARVARDGIAAS